MQRSAKLVFAPFFLILPLVLGACNKVQGKSSDGQNVDALSLQGEYRGVWSGEEGMAAAQIMAQGTGFRILFFDKGLPGESAGSEILAETAGVIADAAVVFTKGEFSARRPLAQDEITGTLVGHGDFVLEKVLRVSATAGAPPPPGARVLFNGTHTSEWMDGKLDSEDNLLAGTTSRKTFRDFHLHLEFKSPFLPQAAGQSRGNSGIYLQKRYEVQILDSFGFNPAASTDTLEPKRHCGAIYEQFAPRINACFPPSTWQTVDMDFKAARFDSTTSGWVKIAPARLTARLNGILIFDDIALINATLGGEAEGPGAGPLYLQYHGPGPVFRNIWVVENDESTSLGFGAKQNQVEGRKTGFSPNPDFPAMRDLGGRVQRLNPEAVRHTGFFYLDK